MRDFFFVVLAAVQECLANYRYGLMSGQMPLGDEPASTTSVSVQECGKFCGDSNSHGLRYDAGTSTCNCYSKVTGYANTVDSSQVGYIQVDDTYKNCLTVAEHQAIIAKMVYGVEKCPPDFTDDGNHCCGSAFNKTVAECVKYGAFGWDTNGHCDLYYSPLWTDTAIA